MPSRPRLLLLLSLTPFLAIVASGWLWHVDLTDAHTYRVLARHMVEDGTWLSLRYLPGAHARFFEHLPFGFWPLAAAVRLLGEWALLPLSALLSLGTLLLTWEVARRAAGPWAGAVAVLALGTCESFSGRAGQPFLEPLLLLLSTASALPLLRGPLRARDWLGAGVLAALACAVKGPFGVLPLAGAAVARAWEERRPATLFLGAGVGVLALVPVGLFLLVDEAWREGYGRHQLLASALGGRSDGSSMLLLPFLAVVRRYWPALPLLSAGLVLAWGRPARASVRLFGERPPAEAVGLARRLALASLFMLAALCVPHRKLWYHALVVFPFLSMLAGVGVGSWLARVTASEAGARRAWRALVALAGVSLVAGAAGLPVLLGPPRCVASAEFAPYLGEVAPGAAVLVVSAQPEWATLAALAAERRWVPFHREALPARAPLPEGAEGARVALVREGAPVEEGAWREVARARGWRLLRRP